MIYLTFCVTFPLTYILPNVANGCTLACVCIRSQDSTRNATVTDDLLTTSQTLHGRQRSSQIQVYDMFIRPFHWILSIKNTMHTIPRCLALWFWRQRTLIRPAVLSVVGKHRCDFTKTMFVRNVSPIIRIHSYHSYVGLINYLVSSWKLLLPSLKCPLDNCCT